MKACPKCGTEYPDAITLCPSDGVALEKTDDSLIGQTLAGKYRIDERLSAGGMGAVYRGTHVLMDKTVAIKVLRPSLAADEKIVARFSREARAASRISHPHALSVTDFGESENGVVFLVMEYLNGKTLKDVIREEGPMSLPRAVAILRQVGDALDAAHAEGVVHRDLKSDNIMLIGTTGADYAKVLDFGIAKIKERDGEYDPGLTAPDLVIGTPQYMSPEQCSQAPDIDARSDIYSLGVILYEMLVGHVPFTGESPTVIMLKQIQEPAPLVSVERPELPSGVSRVVARALEKRPGDRYKTAGELLEDLTVAAGIESPAISTSASRERVVVPVAPDQRDDLDEETLVRRRVTTPMPPVTPPPDSVASRPAPISSFNPWRVLIPSMIGLLVIFAVIYALTRNSQQTETTPQGSTLAADPNSQPVETASPATGASEAGIPLGGSTNQNVNAGNINANAARPTPTEDPNAITNENGNENANENSNRKSTSPPLPSPSRQVEVEPSPALPAPTKAPAPKLPPPNASPTDEPERVFTP
jgi:serine/threonine-protein kinase